MSKQKTVAILIILLVLLTFFGCSKENVKQSEPRTRVLYSFFDTVTLVYSYANDDASSFEKNVSEVEKTLREYHMMMDIYNEYEGMNNLCTVNRNAGEDPVKVDRRLIDFLIYAKNLCELTDNRLDIMMGAVLSLWHDARSAEVQYLPSEMELKNAGMHIGLDLLEIDENACTIRISDPEASIDVGAIGKGYATEMAAEELEKKGISGYVINVGGNLRCIGTKADGSAWVTGIRDPRNPEGLALTVSIADCSCVTSGSYERYLEVGGVRYSHIIDRDTLHPSDRFGSTTVITKDSGLADALATALFCMDYDQGRALVDSLADVQCIWIEKDGTVRRTDGI